MNALTLASLAIALPLGAGAARPARVRVHIGRPAGAASALVHGLALPAPCAPAGPSLLADLLRNGSFEKADLGPPIPMPEDWEKSPGWALHGGGRRQVIRRTAPGYDGPLILVGNRDWPDYRLTLVARKIDGPGGLCVLFEAQDKQNHVRWTLGAMGNRRHVLESVGNGRPRSLAQPVIGRIEAGRCYRIDITLFEGVLRCSLDGRLIHRVGEANFPHAGIGLGAADATAEYFDLTAYDSEDTPLFLLDTPGHSRRRPLAEHWARLAHPRNEVSYGWQPLYPAHSHFSQAIEVARYADGDAGIRQGGVPITAGTTYRGRVHLRAVDQPPVSVSLRSRAGRVYARAELGKPLNSWGAVDFVLTPDGSDPTAEFCITAAAQGRLWVDGVSLRPDGSDALRDDVVRALRTLRPAVLCWPSGSGAHHYDWRNGVGPRHERPIRAVADDTQTGFEPAPNDFGTDEFVALCRSMGAEPVLVINPRLGPGPALDWLAYCNAPPTEPLGKLRAANGHAEPYGVRTWAIGGAPGREEATEADAGQVAALASALEHQDKAVRVAAFGGDPVVGSKWDSKLIARAGTRLSHIGKRLTWHKNPSADLQAVTDAARSFRAHSLSLALLDWQPSEAQGAAATARLLNVLAREGGPSAMAACRCARVPARIVVPDPPGLDLLHGRTGTSPAQAVLALFGSQPLGPLVQAVAEAEGGALDVVAGRLGNEVAVRIVDLGISAPSLRLSLEGSGRITPRGARHVCIGSGSDRLARVHTAQLGVRGSEVVVPLHRERPVHLVTFQLEGE